MSEFGNKVKGKIKQTVGRMTGNDRLRREGERDQLLGEAQGAVADVKKAAIADAKSVADVATEKLSHK